MMGPTGGGASSEAQSVFSLLALVTDPEAAKQRLADLSAKEDQVNKLNADAVASIKQAEQARAVAEAAAAEAKRVAAESSAKNDSWGEQLTKREIKVADREAQVTDREVAVTRAEKDLQASSVDRTASIDARENDIKKREDGLASVLSLKEQDLQQSYQGKLNSANALVAKAQEDSTAAAAARVKAEATLADYQNRLDRLKELASG